MRIYNGAVDRPSRILVLLVVLLVATIIVASPARRSEAGPEDEQAVQQEMPSSFFLMTRLLSLGFILQIAAIIHWSRKRPDTFWIWIIIIGGFIGALAYFLVEGLPDLRGLGSALRGPARRKRIRVLRAIIMDNPAAGNYEELGELLLMEKRWQEAREAFDHALSSRSDSIDPFYRRGIACFELGLMEDALSDLHRVIEADPKYDYSNAYCRYAKALARSGRTAEAMAAFERLSESSSASEILCTCAEFFAVQGRYGEAAEIAQRIVQRSLTMPGYQRRRDRVWIRKAKALLRKLKSMKAMETAAA